jgi:hypothetical protein
MFVCIGLSYLCKVQLDGTLIMSPSKSEEVIVLGSDFKYVNPSSTVGMILNFHLVSESRRKYLVSIASH